MKKELDPRGVQLEEFEIMDLGDAAEETRQFSPIGPVPDSKYGMGEWWL